jgi:hypothetical protein
LFRARQALESALAQLEQEHRLGKIDIDSTADSLRSQM